MQPCIAKLNTHTQLSILSISRTRLVSKGVKWEHQKEKDRLTSTFRPSTMVPWRRSRAFSASALVSNVTKPKPWTATERERNRHEESDRQLKETVHPQSTPRKRRGAYPMSATELF